MNSKTLTMEIWNELIAKPHNEKGSYQLSPAKLKLIIEKHLENEISELTKKVIRDEK